MTYSQLRAFHCVATYGGFSKAAEKTQHSQPVLSGHVKQLEEFYDNLLFKREKKEDFAHLSWKGIVYSYQAVF